MTERGLGRLVDTAFPAESHEHMLWLSNQKQLLESARVAQEAAEAIELDRVDPGHKFRNIEERVARARMGQWERATSQAMGVPIDELADAYPDGHILAQLDASR